MCAVVYHLYGVCEYVFCVYGVCHLCSNGTAYSAAPVRSRAFRFPLSAPESIARRWRGGAIGTGFVVAASPGPSAPSAVFAHPPRPLWSCGEEPPPPSPPATVAAVVPRRAGGDGGAAPGCHLVEYVVEYVFEFVVWALYNMYRK